MATVHAVEKAMHEGGTRCLPELVEIIQSLSSKAKDISVQDLADKIEKHIEVMARVIGVANSFGYNPTGAEIGSVRQAIQVIGFERIRSLVSTLLLVRHAANGESNQEQRRVALTAVCSGFLAQAMAADRLCADPEQAFVIASLRHLGRLLLSTYLHEQYVTVLPLMNDRSETQAFLEVFGLTPLDLSREILLRAGFPKRILASIAPVEDISSKKLPPETANLIRISELSEQFCQLALDRARPSGDVLAWAEQLSAAAGKNLQLSKEQVQELLGGVGQRLDQFTSTLGFGNTAKEAVSILRWRAKRADEGNTVSSNGGTSKVPQKPAPLQEDKARLRRREDPEPEPEELGGKTWRDGLVSLTNFLGETTINLSAMNSLALDFIRKGFLAPESLLLQLEDDQRSYAATHGVGRVFRDIANERVVKRDERTVLGICLARRENVLIHNTEDPKTLPYLPAWAKKERGWGAFVAIPLHDQVSCFGLILIAWPEPQQINLTADNARLLRSLVSTVAAARRLSRS